MKSFIEHDEFLGIDALRFGAGGYEALIVPEVGANIVELKKLEHTGTGKTLNLLRNTEGLTKDAFVGRPQVYGIPVLFTPNRIANGKFNFDGHEYNFPITDKVYNNHLHGFLHKRPWRIAKQEVKENEVIIEAVFECGPQSDFFENFPHEFEFLYRISLSQAGLISSYTISNKGDKKMPLGLGFHTAFCVPFTEDSNEADYLIKATVGGRWELTEALLPTGKYIAKGKIENEMLEDGTKAVGQALDAFHFENKPILRNGKLFSGATLTDTKKKITLVYEWGEKFLHSVIWNNDGKSGFICPEPQTWMINAPNVDLPDEVTGFYALDPGKAWTDCTKIYVE